MAHVAISQLHVCVDHVARLAIDAACFLTTKASNAAWYPRGLFKAYKRSLMLLGGCQLRAAMQHVYEWMGPDNTTDTHVLRLELSAASVTNSLALVSAPRCFRNHHHGTF